jgi:predicted nucleic acid-binding protein
MTLVDTNILLDVLSNDPVWLNWSVEQLLRSQRRGAVVITDVTYAELAVRIEDEADLQRRLDTLNVRLERMPKAALFVAGRAFARYRAAGGPRTHLLPDFFIGAHAQVMRLPILTRDIRRFRHYFPAVQLIAPDESSS